MKIDTYQLLQKDSSGALVYNVPANAQETGAGPGALMIKYEVRGATPDHFLRLYDTFYERKWNDFLKFAKKIHSEDGFDGTHTEVNSVFPTSNRVFYDFVYCFPEKR